MTLFERMMTEYPQAGIMLTTQYRMNTTIMGWSSHHMYNDALIADTSVADHCITDEPRFLMIDTSGAEMFEAMENEGSKYNIGEASLVLIHV